jgi:hypothetical protein
MTALEKHARGRPARPALRQAVVNGAHPPGAGNGPPLGVRNRDHRDRGKGREDHLAATSSSANHEITRSVPP